jgi:hypothetical protein
VERPFWDSLWTGTPREPRNNRGCTDGEHGCGEYDRANIIRPYIGVFGGYKIDGVMVVFKFDWNFEN